MLRRLFTRAAPSLVQAAQLSHVSIPDYFAPNYSGTLVNEGSALGIAAAWRAVNVIVDNVASLPIDGLQAGQRMATPPSIFVRPNSTETRFETFSKIAYSLVMRGNAFGLLGDWDEDMWPQQVEVVHPDLVSITLEASGLTYRVAGAKVDRSQLLHIKGLALPGDHKGIGALEAHRQGLGHILAQEEYGARIYNESAVPSVAIKVDKPNLSQEEAQAIKDAWVAAHGGRSRNPAVFAKGMEVQPLSFTPEDAQYLESRVHSLTDIANIFGVPGDRLGAPGSSRTYANVEQDQLAFVRDTLRPWLVRIEQAFSDLVPPGIEARFNIDALLRADTATRFAAHAIALNNGFETIPEVRELENLPPLPPSEGVQPGQVEALAALIRAGFEPGAALDALGLPPIGHTGAWPVTVKSPQQLEAELGTGGIPTNE